MPERVHRDVDLRALRPLVAVVAGPAAALGGGLHRAAVEDRGRRLGVAAGGEPEDGAEVVDDRLEAAGGEPAAGLLVDHLPGGEVVGQVAPGGAAADEPAQGVEDVAEVVDALAGVLGEQAEIRGTNKIVLWGTTLARSRKESEPKCGAPTMAKPLLPDALWERIAAPAADAQAAPLPLPRPQAGSSDRKALTGILFVLKTGIDWEDLPQEMGCGCGMTCWRRLAEWTAAGVWQRLHELLLAELEYAGEIDWSRATIDSSHVRARGGGEGPAPARWTGGRRGASTSSSPTPAGSRWRRPSRRPTVPDVKGLEPAVDAMPPVRGKPGRPRRRPRELYGDRGFDSDPHRRRLRRRGIRPRIARRGTAHGSGLGVYRWVSERTLSWLHNFGRLRVRKDHSAAIHQAFLTLGCSIICLNHLVRLNFVSTSKGGRTPTRRRRRR